MKIFGWNIEFWYDIREWAIPFGFRYFSMTWGKVLNLDFLCFGVTFEKD